METQTVENKRIFRKIVGKLFRRELQTLSELACPSRKALREFPKRELVEDRENIRSAFSHDTDRIIYSNAYARYIDKTQVFYLFENDHITHRVLHVQLVAKIGRLIARCLRLNEDLVEAIAIGHDLGHVPYGHDGEKVLKQICSQNNIGSFCHNAQSVRFLMEIEKRGEGLNLSLQVLDGILCHNGEILSAVYRPNKQKTWAVFREEYEQCLKQDGYDRELMSMTLEGCVVRISDIIAYIGRDLEDAVTLRVMKWEEIPTEVTNVLGKSNRQIVNKLVMDLIEHSYGKPELTFSNGVYNALDQLRKFSSKRIYQDSRIRSQGGKIKRMFEQLFAVYHEDVKSWNKESVVFTEFLRDMRPDYSHNNPPARIAIDFIAGMTDRFFNKQYQQLFFPHSYGLHLDEQKSAHAPS